MLYALTLPPVKKTLPWKIFGYVSLFGIQLILDVVDAILNISMLDNICDISKI